MIWDHELSQESDSKLRRGPDHLVLLEGRHSLVGFLLAVQSSLHLPDEVLEHTPESLRVFLQELRGKGGLRAHADGSELGEFLPEGKLLGEVWIAMSLVQFSSKDKDNA